MIRVLHIVGAMYPGGFENFIMNLYEHIDREKIQFDMVVHQRKENDYVEKIQSMGGKVYELPRMTRHPIQNLKGLYRLVKDEQYAIVVRHTSNALVAPQLIAARMAGAQVICHSHSESDANKLLHGIGRVLMDLGATRRFACSEQAGKWMFGSRSCIIVKNAIDIRRFAYRKEADQVVRKEFHLGDCKIYGHIGNFSDTKNHLYLLSIFREIADRDPLAILICLGDGDLRPQIEQEIMRLKLQERVILAGMRNDPEDFMSCFNVLIFPSKFEGVPLTLIEAQAAGLPCLISDTINKEVIITKGLIKTKALEEEPKAWAMQAMEMAENADRECQYGEIAEAGYDIDSLAKWYEDYFIKLV